MKCPKCGHWNKDTFPHCFTCGHPLPARGERSPAWREKFHEPPPQKKRIVYDDTVDPVESLIEEAPKAPSRPVNPQPPTRRRRASLPKEPELLAEEMTHLRDRRARGTVYLQQFRERAAKEGIAPSGAGVSIRRGGFSAGIPDNPDVTVRPISPPADVQAGDGDAYDDEAGDFPAYDPDVRYAPPAARYPQDRDAYQGQAPFLPYESPYAAYDEDLPPAFDAAPPIAPYQEKRRGRVRGPIVLAYVLVILLVLSVLAFGAYAVASYLMPSFLTRGASTQEISDYELIPSTTSDGLPAHVLKIPGAEGASVFIAELARPYVVVDGYATIEIPDHVFYDTLEHLDQDMESMDAVLTPTLIQSGSETRLEQIRYTINVPESRIELRAPEAEKTTVNTSIYTIRLGLEPNSRVMVNGNDESDKLREDGEFNTNVAIQAIGTNVVAITVKAPYCREKMLTLEFYRAPMEIPLELNPATLTNTIDEQLTIYGTTMPGASIHVESPTFEVYREEFGENDKGNFYVKAKMTRVGTNKVIIRASCEGMADSVLEHDVYYLPSRAEYTPKAWALSAQDYTELLNNINLRIERAQIYLCEGTVKQILGKIPQLAIMDTSTTDREQLVLLENTESDIVWEVGQQYSVYADVSGVYNNMPRLTARYTYPYKHYERARATSSPDPDASQGATDDPGASPTDAPDETAGDA